MPHRISAADDTTPTETRRGRAWIDQAAGVRIGYSLAGTSPGVTGIGRNPRLSTHATSAAPVSVSNAVSGTELAASVA